MIVGLVVLGVALVGIGVAIGIASGGRVIAAPKPITGKPRVVFSDDFQDPGSGWPTHSPSQGVTFAYTSAGYVVSGSGRYHWFARAPYYVPVPQLTMSVTATQVTNGQGAVGFGVACVRGIGSSITRYELLVNATRRWFIERALGPPGPTSTATIIDEGSSPMVPGATPMTVSGSCLTKADGRTTDLVVWVNGTKVGSAEDDATSLAGTGWYGQLIVATEGTRPCPVTATNFEERTGALTH